MNQHWCQWDSPAGLIDSGAMLSWYYWRRKRDCDAGLISVGVPSVPPTAKAWLTTGGHAKVSLYVSHLVALSCDAKYRKFSHGLASFAMFGNRDLC